MIIDFDKIEVSIMPAFKGGEKETRAAMFTDENNRIMMGMLIPGATIGLHRHEGSSEVIFIQSGSGKVLYDGKYEEVKAGDVHYCPEGHEQSLINDSEENLTYFAVVPNHGI